MRSYLAVRRWVDNCRVEGLGYKYLIAVGILHLLSKEYDSTESAINASFRWRRENG